jgi:hypothetical protein
MEHGGTGMTTAQVHHDKRHSFEATIVGALLLSIIFLLCWITSARGNIPHAFVELFTAEPGGSVSAIFGGLPLALGFGAAGGALVDIGRYLVSRRGR